MMFTLARAFTHAERSLLTAARQKSRNGPIFGREVGDRGMMTGFALLKMREMKISTSTGINHFSADFFELECGMTMLPEVGGSEA